MFKNQTIMESKGVFNFFNVENEDKVMVLSFSDETFVIPFIKTSDVSYNAYLNTTDTKLFKDMNDYIQTSMPSVYKETFKDAVISLSLGQHPTLINTKILQRVDGLNNSAIINIEEDLVTHGYDTSNLHNKIKCTTFNKRDYSLLISENEYARKMFEDTKAMLEEEKISFVLPQNLQDVANSIANKFTNTVFFTGPAGTGKSILTRILSQNMGAPLFNIQLTEGITIEELLGQFIPSDKGGYEFVRGRLLQAYEEGWQIVLEEVNYASPNILSVLNQFADNTFSISYAGKVFKRNPNFVMYMTMNSGYDGTYTLNVALKSRGVKVVVDALTQSEYVSRCISYSKKFTSVKIKKDFFNNIYKYQEFCKSQALKMGENCEFCIRQAQQLMDLTLISALSEEEFTNAVYKSFTNNLVMDNGEYDKLISLKEMEEQQKLINNIYKFYPFIEPDDINGQFLLCFKDAMAEPVVDSSNQSLDDMFDNESLDKLSAATDDATQLFKM